MTLNFYTRIKPPIQLGFGMGGYQLRSKRLIINNRNPYVGTSIDAFLKNDRRRIQEVKIPYRLLIKRSRFCNLP